MIGGKINLQTLTHVKMEVNGKNGKVQGIFIQFEINHIHVGEKGCYLDLVAFPLKEAKDYQTHLVKQSLPKEVREKMSDEDKKNQPIIGLLNISDGQQQSVNNDVNGGKVASPDDDLPF